MKKLLIAAAIVCAAVVSQAAVAVTWKTGTGVKDITGAEFTKDATGYICSIAFSENNDMSDPISGLSGTTSSSYSTKGTPAAGFNGKTGNSFDAGTYYAQLTITKDGRTYKSDIASFTVAEGALNGPTINFTTGDNIGGASKIGDTNYYPLPGPDPIPEPTSALLLLLGVAGLSLRRRRA